MKTRTSEMRALVGKDEMNLADFAIGIIGSGTELKTIERSQVIKTSESRLEQSWSVTGSAKWGLPQPCDDDILLALFYLASEKRFQMQNVIFSRYGLCQIMGWSRCGKNYEKIEDGLRRLSTVKIEARQSFFDGHSKNYVSRVFGILDGYTISECSRLKNLERSSARFSDVIWKSVEAENLKRIDLKIYYSLRSPIAKRLYRFLDKRRAKKPSFDLELDSLASMNLGLSSETRRFPSQIKQTLDRAHKELEKIGFLKLATYFKGSNGRWRVRYTFGKDLGQNFQETSALKIEPTDTPPPRIASACAISSNQETPLEERALTERGVSCKRARELALAKPNRILDLIDFYDFVLSNQPSYWQNPVGWLIRAVEDGYIIPIDFPGYQPPAQRKRLEKDKEMLRERKRLAELKDVVEREEVRKSIAVVDELPPEDFIRLAALTRSAHSWLKKIPDDHPAFRAAVLDFWRSESREDMS
jgi:hypothetical protein